MIRKQSLVILMCAAASVVIVVGCQTKKQPTRTDQKIQPAVMTDTNERMSELQRKSEKLSSIVKQLPGRDAKEDRELVAQAFDATHDSLSMMAGPEPGGATRQQLRILENIRQFLRTGDPKLSYDPSVDAGLRATHNALEGVRDRLFPNDQKVRSLVADFGGRLSELDQVRGPMHSVVVAQVFQSAAGAIDTMGDMLNARNQMVTEMSAPSATPPAAAPAPPSAPPAPAAAPAAATAPPAAPPASAHAAAPAPPPAPQAPEPLAAPAPTAAAPPPPQSTADENQELRKQNEELQRKLDQLQQQQGQPAAAPVSPAPAAPAPAPAPAAPPAADSNNK
jgi:hypothetical protein